MNRGRKIKHSLSIKDEENNSPKNEPTPPTSTVAATKHKLLTPCRRVGLNRKRKNITSGLSESSSELNISSPNNSLTEIDISGVKEHDSTTDANKINIETPVLKKTIKPRKHSLGARKRTNQTTNTNNDVLLSPEEISKYKQINNIIRDVSVVLTRCDFDKHILNRDNVRESSVDTSLSIENEAISSTPLEANDSEIQTNQISTTIDDATPTENDSINEIDVTEKNSQQSINKSVTSKKIKDLFGDNSDDSDFESNIKLKKRKRFSLKTSSKTNKKDTSTTNEDTNDDSSQNSLEQTGTEIQKNSKADKDRADENINRKIKKPIKPNKENINELLKEPDIDMPKTKTKPSKEEKQKNKIHKRDTDSQVDSDDTPELNVNIPRKKRKRSSSHSKKSPKITKKENATKPRQLYNSDSDDDFMEKPRREKKDPDIKKKINIPTPDPLNRIEHIRIRENKSYTIMHMNNISSYVKYYDNDVNLKRTESDDNQQTTSQPIVSNVKTSMILERKDYLNKGSQEINHNSENSERTNLVDDCSENTETTNIFSDCIENSETSNVIRNATEDSNNLECINGVSDSIENPDGFAGFSNNMESPGSANINSVENPDSNDIENSNLNDIDNYNSNDNNTIEKPGSNETIEIAKLVGDIEKPETTISGFENPENVSDSENLDDPQNEMKKMLKLKSNLINQIKMKRDKLDSLKRIMAYKEEHNLDDLTKTTLQFKYTLQEALVDLLSHLKTHTERNFNMLLLLGFLKIPSEMVGYNDETKSFE